MDENRNIRKVEFKLHFGSTQIQRMKEYLSAQRWVWNRGLALIEWREWYDKWAKVMESPDRPEFSVEPLPMRWGHYQVGVKKGGKPDVVYGLCCDRVRAEKTTHEPLPGEWRDGDWLLKPGKPDPVKEHWTQEPLLPSHGKDPYFSLVSAFGKKKFADQPEHFTHDVPTAWTKGTCKILADAWKTFKGGVRDRPRYKKRHQVPKTLMHPNSKEIKISGDRLTLPGFGKVKVKGLAKRWGDRPACPMTLTLVGDTVYLQLTGEFPAKPLPKITGRTAGIDPGSVRLYTDDEGNYVVPPRNLKKSAKKLHKLQRKLSRQLKVNGTQIFNEEGRCIRTEFPEDWERKNFQKTKAEIAKLHDKIARQRRATSHYESTKLVRMFDTIILEDFKVGNLTRAVKKGEAGKQNGRKRKSALNRNLLDNAIGQMYGMTEAKGKDCKRIVKRVSAYRTSQRCNVCKYEDKANRKSQSRFKCVKCGHEDNADRNAARNIKDDGLREA